MDNFDIYEIKLNIYEMSKISDDALASFLSGETGKDAILKIVIPEIMTLKSEFDIDNFIEYYHGLIKQVEGIINVQYTEEEKQIISLYAIPRRSTRYSLDEFSHLMSLYGDIAYADTETEGITFLRDYIRHRLLDMYVTTNDESYFQKMKKLLFELKSNKDAYAETQKKIRYMYRIN